MSKTAVTRVTHSCHLIPIGGSTFLTYPWFSTRPGCYQGEPIAVGITITATPKHGVHENTFVLRSGPEAVYFTTSPSGPGSRLSQAALIVARGWPSFTVKASRRRGTAAVPGTRAPKRKGLAV